MYQKTRLLCLFKLELYSTETIIFLWDSDLNSQLFFDISGWYAWWIVWTMNPSSLPRLQSSSKWNKVKLFFWRQKVIKFAPYVNVGYRYCRSIRPGNIQLNSCCGWKHIFTDTTNVCFCSLSRLKTFELFNWQILVTQNNLVFPYRKGKEEITDYETKIHLWLYDMIKQWLPNHQIPAILFLSLKHLYFCRRLHSLSSSLYLCSPLLMLLL